MPAVTETVEAAVARSGGTKSHWAPSTFVWSVWTFMVVGALAFIRTYGSNVPFCDDWGLVLVRTGDRPVTLGWLWGQVAEYRTPLPKLLVVLLGRLTDNDLRAEMFFGAGVLGFLAFAMVRAMARLRGWTSYSDAMFPLVLLHLGHHASFLWSFVSVYLVANLLVGMFLLIILRAGRGLAPGTAVLAGVCLMLMALCGPLR